MNAAAADASAARTPFQPRVILPDTLFEVVYRQPHPFDRMAVAGVPAADAVAMMLQHLGLPGQDLRTEPVKGQPDMAWVVPIDTGTRIARFDGLGPQALAAHFTETAA